MDDLYNIFASNLVRLRKEKKLTQFELANILNYSDRNVSKWENGQALPTTEVMYELANFFNVTIDYLLTEHKDEEITKNKKDKRIKNKDHLLITGLSILCVLLIITIIQVVLFPVTAKFWIIYIYAIPVALIVLLVFNIIWFKKFPYMFIIMSLLMWSCLFSLHLSLFVFLNINWWLIYIIGIPLQIGVIIWSRFSHYHKK